MEKEVRRDASKRNDSQDVSEVEPDCVENVSGSIILSRRSIGSRTDKRVRTHRGDVGEAHVDDGGNYSESRGQQGILMARRGFTHRECSNPIHERSSVRFPGHRE